MALRGLFSLFPLLDIGSTIGCVREGVFDLLFLAGVCICVDVLISFLWSEAFLSSRLDLRRRAGDRSLSTRRDMSAVSPSTEIRKAQSFNGVQWSTTNESTYGFSTFAYLEAPFTSIDMQATFFYRELISNF